MYMVKYYYENLLSNQNVTAKTNVTWVADITTLKLFRNQMVYVFLCIDIHTNYIVAYFLSKKTITSQSVVRTLEKSINQRFTTPGDRKLIIHTDHNSLAKHITCLQKNTMSILFLACHVKILQQIILLRKDL